MKRDVPLSQNPFAAAYTSLGAEVLDNFYLEDAQSGTSKAKYYQVGRQGLRLLYQGSIGSGCRGLFVTSSNRLFAVNGSALYEFTAQGTVRAQIGTLNTSTGPVYMRENSFQLFIVDGGYGYIFDLTSGTFQQITSEFFPGVTESGVVDTTKGPSHAAMIDTYFLANNSGTNKYYWSAPYYQPYSFDPLQPSVQNLWWGTYFGQKIGDTDNIIAMIENVNLLWVFGQNSMEIHRDTGNTSGQLFSRIDTALIGFGCAAKHSVCKLGNLVFWLGRDRSGTIGMFQAGMDFQPNRISKRGIETRIQTYDRLDDCIAFPFSIDGHNFIEWIFPSGSSVDGGPVTGATWIYDLTTQEWYRYTRWDATTGTSSRWRAQFAASNWGMLIMGDATTDSLYVLDNTYFQDDHPDGSGSDFINRILTSPIGYDDGKLVTYDACQLNMQQGTALRTGQGSAPVAMMAYSDDSGFTFGLEQSRSMGLTGQYAYRTRWTRCRSSRNRVWRFRITEPVRTIVVGMTLEFREFSR